MVKEIYAVEHQSDGCGIMSTDVHLRIWGEEAFDYDIGRGGDIDALFYPLKVIIKCQHCGQWGAKKCACKHCGAPIG